MTPTSKTYWHFIQAKSAGAMASLCLRAGSYKLAQRHADAAKEHWHKVEWRK